MTIAGLNIDLPDGLGASSDLFVHSILIALAALGVKCLYRYIPIPLKIGGKQILFFREFQAERA